MENKENNPKCEKGGRSATHKEEKTMSSGQKLYKVQKEHGTIRSLNTSTSTNTNTDTDTSTNTMSIGRKPWKEHCPIWS